MEYKCLKVAISIPVTVSVQWFSHDPVIQKGFDYYFIFDDSLLDKHTFSVLDYAGE